MQHTALWYGLLHAVTRYPGCGLRDQVGSLQLTSNFAATTSPRHTHQQGAHSAHYEWSHLRAQDCIHSHCLLPTATACDTHGATIARLRSLHHLHH